MYKRQPHRESEAGESAACLDTGKWGLLFHGQLPFRWKIDQTFGRLLLGSSGSQARPRGSSTDGAEKAARPKQ